MEKQTDKAYAPINQSGCYFISCGVWAEELSNEFVTDETVNLAYAFSVVRDYMDTECFIIKPDMVINVFLELLGSEKRVEYIGWWNEDTGFEFFGNNTAEDIDFEILRVGTPWGFHFKTPGFNPYPNLAQGDEINGRRYFKVI